jgi:hypothetical protein
MVIQDEGVGLTLCEQLSEGLLCCYLQIVVVKISLQFHRCGIHYSQFFRQLQICFVYMLYSLMLIPFTHGFFWFHLVQCPCFGWIQIMPSTHCPTSMQVHLDIICFGAWKRNAQGLSLLSIHPKKKPLN